MKILLTIDTEGVRGNDPVLTQIWGKIGEEYYGIPKIIELCDKYQFKGLFFVDFAEVYDYGYEKIKEVVKFIKSKGHDVGVHIHPHHYPLSGKHFLYEYSYEEQYQIISDCTKLYEEMVGEPPLSFRAGKYGANYDTLDIISKLGYKYDFSEFYSQKWCGIQPPVCYNLPVEYKDIVEIPVTVFKSLSLGKFYHRFDKLEVSENPQEVLHVLKQYSKTCNQETIILFLHSFSFLHFLKSPNNPTPNRKHLRNFAKVLAALNKREDYTKISERDLLNIEVYREDTEKSIIKTKGFFRQIRYSFLRLIKIRNTKAKKLIATLLIGFGVLLVGVGAILLGGLL